MDRYSQNTTSPGVRSVQDYYPFGMHMPGRSFVSGDGHRYGFNGMERDDDIKGEGNSYDFGARMYDNRLGRWWKTDPLSGQMPDVSPYNFGGNCPTFFIDADGKIIKGFNSDDAAKTLIAIQTIFSDYEVIQQMFDYNSQTLTFNQINLKEIYNELGKIEDADVRAIGWALAQAVNSDVTYEVSFVSDGQDISNVSGGSFSTGADLDKVRGGGSNKLHALKASVLLNENSIQRTSKDRLLNANVWEILANGGVPKGNLVSESAVVSGIIASMYHMSDPFLGENAIGFNSGVGLQLKTIQVENTIQRILGEPELGGELRYGRVLDDKLKRDPDTPQELRPRYSNNPRTLSSDEEFR